MKSGNPSKTVFKKPTTTTTTTTTTTSLQETSKLVTITYSELYHLRSFLSLLFTPVPGSKSRRAKSTSANPRAAPRRSTSETSSFCSWRWLVIRGQLDVSENGGVFPPKIIHGLIGLLHVKNHPFWGKHP